MSSREWGVTLSDLLFSNRSECLCVFIFCLITFLLVVEVYVERIC